MIRFCMIRYQRFGKREQVPEIYKRDSLSHYLNTKVLICRLSRHEAGREQLPENYKITILRDHTGLGNIYIPDA